MDELRVIGQDPMGDVCRNGFHGYADSGAHDLLHHSSVPLELAQVVQITVHFDPIAHFELVRSRPYQMMMMDHGSIRQVVHIARRKAHTREE